jgi:hypothetical protein
MFWALAGLVLELPKSLAVTRINFFMVYDGNYFNCSTLVDAQIVVFGRLIRTAVARASLFTFVMRMRIWNCLQMHDAVYTKFP